ncbi:glycosyltransferase [Nocardioides sp. dk4132]|uniref:glycosyltransferase n=1 Tax=unclassified Nocardioides TaxID=2615069 RepID=UPI001295DB2E|nr:MULTISPECIES: glycosyltransferase [unclassified Nocardioides]MQW75319.1 glycosyltransferase [Nocardioides sp. dk4132]QGA07531.1 glycosyltransferase [Nocardioides sp. dk884]
MRVCLIASSRYPVREPFAGGLEALTHQLARQLAARGHEVSLFAASGSDPDLPVTLIDAGRFEASPAAQRDVNAPSASWMAEHHAYLTLMLDLARDGAGRFDLVHNHSLHHLPVAMAPMLEVPLLTTLHTPPVPWLESAIATAPGASAFTAVSRRTAQAWSHVVASDTVLNGVDVNTWRLGPGGGPAVWSGRLVREKAPHVAIDAARAAGLPIVLVGPAPDPDYFAECVAPRLGPDAVYAGHLDHRAIAGLLGRAAVAVVTPEWDEPYGLVAAEAMACGTPVAAYARGALPELVDASAGALARPGDPADLAAAIDIARRCDRRAVRRHAVERLSAERMVSEYEQRYARLVGVEAA